MKREILGADMGTMALDCPIYGDYSDTLNMGGLQTVDPENRITSTGEVFTEPARSVLEKNSIAGGIANGANAIAEVLKATGSRQQWAIMAWLGEDDVARIWREQLHKNLDTRLLKTIPQLPSGLSVIEVQAPQFATDQVPAGQQRIRYRPGASGYTEFSDEDVTELTTRRPFNVNISYPGLFPDGADRDQGWNLNWFITEMQRVCPCVSMDTHGQTRLADIRSALLQVDMFNANLPDAVRMLLDYQIHDDVRKEEKMNIFAALGYRLTQEFLTSNEAVKGRSRMFTITDREGTYVLVYNPHNNTVAAEYVESPCKSIPAKNKTGAGDVRFGLQRLTIAMSAQEIWQSGSLDLISAELAVNVGQIATTLHIQGKEADALRGVSLPQLMAVAGSGEEFAEISALQTALSRYTALPPQAWL